MVAGGFVATENQAALAQTKNCLSNVRSLARYGKAPLIIMTFQINYIFPTAFFSCIHTYYYAKQYLYLNV